MNQTVKNNLPDRKVTVGGACSFTTTIVVWFLNTHHAAQIPADIAVAFAGLLTFVTQYFVPNR